jgi:transposase-like protein
LWLTDVTDARHPVSEIDGRKVRPMSRPPALTQQAKTRLILQVLSGELNLTQAGQRAGVSAQAVSNWRRQFVHAGSRALQAHGELRPDQPGEVRLRQLAAEVQALKIALADAHVALSAQRHRSGPPGGRIAG